MKKSVKTLMIASLLTTAAFNPAQSYAHDRGDEGEAIEFVKDVAETLINSVIEVSGGYMQLENNILHHMTA